MGLIIAITEIISIPLLFLLGCAIYGLCGGFDDEEEAKEQKEETSSTIKHTTENNSTTNYSYNQVYEATKNSNSFSAISNKTPLLAGFSYLGSGNEPSEKTLNTPSTIIS